MGNSSIAPQTPHRSSATLHRRRRIKVQRQSMMFETWYHRLWLWRRRHPKIFVSLLITLFASACYQSWGKFVRHSANDGVTSKSLSHRQQWFEDGKLGIFIHWGLYSVPAWAVTGLDFGEMTTGDNSKDKEWNHWFKNNAYAEWYFNTLRINQSPTQEYHRKVYGNKTYDEFVPIFNRAVKNWDPDKMAKLFKDVHAQYVVLTSKHHDGFLMWPSKHPNPYKKEYHADRNIVGELGQAVKKLGMRMAYYYSGGVDWTFNPQLVQKHEDVRSACIQGDAYVDYANSHWRELIDDYDTSILWNDICYPSNADVNKLHSYYYKKNPEGLVNQRFTQYNNDGTVQSVNHYDFETPEYKSFPDIHPQKWESCRGIGHSFGYNQLEGPEHYLSVEELVRSFVDIVSKNGNLLLNVGPKADGNIPEIQEERLRGLGKWLDRNGEAIFKTRPWKRASGTTDEGIKTRFTQNGDALYVILMSNKLPAGQVITVHDLPLANNAQLSLLGHQQSNNLMEWQQTNKGVLIHLPKDTMDAPAHCIKVTPMPK